MQSPLRRSFVFALLLGLSTISLAAQERPASEQEYRAQFDQRDWPAAIAAAERLVASARVDAQRAPFALVDALALLGNAQLGSGDFPGAEATFAEALELAEKGGGPSHARLLDPLRGMGYTLAASGKHEQAVPYLDRALVIARRNYGLFDINQQGVLRQLGASLATLGRGGEAARHMNYMLRVGEQAYGKGDPRLAPLICQVAEWYSEGGVFEPARNLFRSAIAIVDKKVGRNDIALVEPLRGLARTYTHELFYVTRGVRTDRRKTPTDADGASNENQPVNPRNMSPEGEKALERALRIVESQPTPSREMRLGALIQLGDWRQIRHQPSRALSLYQRAAQLLVSEPADDAGVRPLSFPVRVYYPMPWLATRNLSLPADEVDETFVQIEFTVTKNGEVADARVVEENGTSRHVAESLDAIRAARYRPKFLNGEPVDTPGMTNREVFRVRKQTRQEKTS